MGSQPHTGATLNAGTYAVATYRYLRLSIVVVVSTLAVSLVEQAAKHRCVQGSISAFYYTPVHSIFIAALGLIGVALIAIRGATSAREALLNTAGFLAPVVAFVPTGRPVGAVRCPIDGAIGTIPASFPDNNLWGVRRWWRAGPGLGARSRVRARQEAPRSWRSWHR